MSLLAAVLLVLLVLLAAAGRVGAAPEYAIVVDLAVEAGQQPAYLCIITARGSLTARNEPYSLPLSLLENGALEPGETKDGRPFAATISPDLAVAVQKGKREAIALALELLTRRTSSDSCAASYDECAPRMWSTSTRTWFSRHASATKSEDLHITCAANSAGDRAAPAGALRTVAILSLDFIQGQDMPVAELRLDGSAAAIAVRGATAGSETASVRVVGGDYLVGASYFAARGRVSVPLLPLCAVHSVRLPALHLPAVDELSIALRRAGEPKPIRTCRPTVTGNQLGVRLPRSTRRDDYALEVTGNDVAMSTTWSAAVPTELALHVDSIGFRWSVDCTYPLSRASCPTATVDGVPCDPPTPGEDASGDDTCSYRCTTKGAFELPSTVEFIQPYSVKRWTAALRFPGQVIAQYVDPATRSVRMSFPGWDKLPLIERLSIRGVELDFPSGNHKFIDLRAWLLEARSLDPLEVAIPDVSCSQALKYRVVSDKLTAFENLRPSDGGVDVPVPRCGFDVRTPCFTPSTSVGVGGLNRSRSGGLPATGLGNTFTLYGYFHVDNLPWGEPKFFEFGYSATLGSREYLAVGPGSISSAATPYGRAGFEFLAGVRSGDGRPFVPSVRLGLGLSGGWGHALAAGDGAKVHGDWYFSPLLFVRWGDVSLVARLMLFEELVEVSTATGQRLRDHTSIPIGYELRYTF